MRTEKYEAHRRTYLLVFKRWSVGVRVNANEKEETTYTSQNQTSVRMLKVHHDRICACRSKERYSRVLLCSIHVADRTEFRNILWCRILGEQFQFGRVPVFERRVGLWRSLEKVKMLMDIISSDIP